MKTLKKWNTLPVVLALTLVLGLLVLPVKIEASGKKKVKLNKTKITLIVGKTATLKIKNAPKGKKVIWSTNKKKVATVSKKGKVTAKKVGTAKITAKVAKKKYTCKVTVKKKAASAGTTPETPSTEGPGSQISDIILQNTEGKNASDIAILKKIIQEQKASGATVSLDLDSCDYEWNAYGRLTAIDWGDCEDHVSRGPTGSISFEGLTALEYVCWYVMEII